MPATMETGMEITRAPGHAITSKVSASSTFWVMRPTANAAIMTPGVYHLEKRSKNVCVFALSSCASSTRWMIFAKVDSDPTAVASTRSTPLRSQVPAKTSAPSDFSAGTDSPVMLASSTPANPDITRPSTGICSPLRTRTFSPGISSQTSTVSVEPSSCSFVAVSGAESTKSLKALRVRFIVAFSKALPKAKRNVTAADSQ